LIVPVSAFGQTSVSALPSLPNDPGEILAAAQPLYDFNSADLKPWHLKAAYQLYNQSGKPSEEGTFEYWWSSPSKLMDKAKRCPY
jgi:hypothetical protein